ncbi:hypothetical protein GCM10008905_08360 [Clostridium malenominatum]|uniref:Antirestriction protein (ArdA) n=1 Tax=Clostridium malenominatum TaxID=1539 RepID=A0ABN1IRD5_9CLOT
MNNYIFLTHEGCTYQPNSESDVPDIENLQVIGFSHGINPKEAFCNLIGNRTYLLNTSFDMIFCYELSKNYRECYTEFSIKDDYNAENYEQEEVNDILDKISKDMDLNIDESNWIFNAIFNIAQNNLATAKDIIINERYGNYYLGINNYSELCSSLINDEALWDNKYYYKNLYEFLLKDHSEKDLKERLQGEGWFISEGFAICLDRDVIL